MGPLAGIVSLLQREIGLDKSIVGPAVIERAVRLRMKLSGSLQPEQYWQKLQASTDELQELIEEVTVPETWFFRYPESFNALARIATQDRLTKHKSQPLRVLSVPCSSGEEPYSIAITLLQAGLPGDRFIIDAVDVSQRSLTKAQDASYRQTSFRNGELEWRELYFQHSQGYRHVAECARQQVRFLHGNLFAADFLIGEEPYDVIFCRNVLIYFDRVTQEPALQKLDPFLASNGILFVGAGEIGAALAVGCKPTDSPGSFALRKAGCKPSQPASPATQPIYKPVGVLRAPSLKRTVAKKATATPFKVQPEPAGLTRESATVHLDRATCLADAGRLSEAALACEAHLREAGASAPAYYLLGLVNDALGNATTAADCYRKALYLEPNHPEALQQFALTMEHLGDSAAARRLRERSRRNECQAA